MDKRNFKQVSRTIYTATLSQWPLNGPLQYYLSNDRYLLTEQLAQLDAKVSFRMQVRLYGINGSKLAAVLWGDATARHNVCEWLVQEQIRMQQHLKLGMTTGELRLPGMHSNDKRTSVAWEWYIMDKQLDDYLKDGILHGPGTPQTTLRRGENMWMNIREGV